MRVLYPAAQAQALTAAEIREFYAEGWLTEGGVRANFVSSVNGSAAAADGLSRGLQTPGDNAVFAALRDLADVILVGASTANAENYGPINLSAQRRAIRAELGLAPQPALAIVSASLNLDLTAKRFTEATADAPTIVVTGPHASMSARNDVIDLTASCAGLQLVDVASGPGEVSVAATIERLIDLGYRRVLFEGGPRLFAAGLLEHAVTELCLSVSPMLVQPDGPGIVGAASWPAGFQPSLQLRGLLTEDDALFYRYGLR